MKFCKKLYDINSVKEFFFENGILIFFEQVNWGRGPPLIFASGYFSALGGPERETNSERTPKNNVEQRILEQVQ